MIKVLFLIPTLGHGGAERVLVNLVNHMDKTKFDITIQTLFDVGIYQEKIDKKVRYIPGFKWYFRGNTKIAKLFSSKFLYKKLIRKEYDIVVSYLEGMSSRIVSGSTNKSTKLVSWIHVEQDNYKYASSCFKSKEEAINSYNIFDKVICVSETVKKDFLKLFPRENVEVIYNTVETERILALKDEKIDDVYFKKNTVNIVSVAKLMKVKGYDRLIRVIKRLVDDGLNIHMYIVGKGEEFPNLEKIVKENNLENNWSFLGFKENPYKYVAACDLYVCSSYREGFSTSVTESLIIGTPVVSTDCSGAIELLGSNNNYGIVTENDENSLYEGIKKILTEEGLLHHYKNKTLERGRTFKTMETVKAVEMMLEKLVSK